MKTILLLSAMLIATSAFVQGAPSGAGPKIYSPKDDGEKKSPPNNVLIINFDHLRNETKDVSILKPVFMIITAITNASAKLHGRNFKICCNKSSN